MKTELEHIKFENLNALNYMVKACPCPRKNCSNHGKCEECKDHYILKKGTPFCGRNLGFFYKIFNKKTYRIVEDIQKSRNLKSRWM